MLKKIAISITLFLSFIEITNAIPVAVLVIGQDFFLLLFPTILTILSVLYFYLKNYNFQINIGLLSISTIFYFIHFYITKDFFLFKYEYLIFIALFGSFFIIKKIKILNYFYTFLFITFLLFTTKINYNLYKYYGYASEYIEKIGEEKIEKYQIKDNFLVIYFKEGQKQLVVSNCLEGETKKSLLFRKAIKDQNKRPLKNGICLYGHHEKKESRIMYKILTN